LIAESDRTSSGRIETRHADRPKTSDRVFAEQTGVKARLSRGSTRWLFAAALEVCN
jgi:hypothetical protein